MAATAQTEPKYWPAQRLADHLGVSKWTVYRACKPDDGWPHSRIGGLRFSPDDVAEIERRIRHMATSAPEPKYSAAQLAHAAQRLGLPGPRRGS